MTRERKIRPTQGSSVQKVLTTRRIKWAPAAYGSELIELRSPAGWACLTYHNAREKYLMWKYHWCITGWGDTSGKGRKDHEMGLRRPAESINVRRCCTKGIGRWI